MFLRLENLAKVFTSRDGSALVRAVDDVNLIIEKGEFVTLLGPSGCGKTTTLRLIAGFEFPSEGRIVLDGQEINELPPNQRNMAMVFQSYAIFPHLSVFENIAYGLKIKKIAGAELRRQVGQALDLTELTGLENRQPNQLSGGQQQRVALARALVMNPKVLLFDEPLSNLDAKLRVQMRSEIRRIQQGLAITSVYVTHDQDEAMVLSDKIVVMHNGRIQQADTAPNIYRRPANRFVADFIGRANFLPVTVLDRLQDRWLVQLHDLQVSVPVSPQFMPTPGNPALLLVRPESIRLSRGPQNGQPTLTGKVERTAYLGSLAEYEVAVAGEKLAAVHYDPGVEDLYPVGATINLELISENLYLLPNEES
ncbi:MAG: ABC transporter ATP-binding protein [Caldilineaceae bacterium]|nr:ABC transporter ATP-binding protein [Caldilineaceae bacterium]